MNEHDPDAIIARVLARFQGVGRSMTSVARATLVIDENVSFLEKPMKDANFHTVVPPKGMEDFEIKKVLLAHRVIITKNTKDFLDDAPVLDYGIIGLEALPFIDPAGEYKDNTTAQMISKAISEFGLISKRTGFVLMLKPNGRHVFKDLG
jgi:hypothetical protein